MTSGQLTHLLAHIRGQVAGEQAVEPPDQELLARYVTNRDESAFAALVQRHGAMVLNVCRRLLHHAQDAEDACQATLLVLAQRAGTIRKHDALASWLHGVAHRVAGKQKRDLGSRAVPQRTGREVAQPDTTAEIAWREVKALLDDELSRLPGTYRAPLVLCYLEGKTQDEAARQLGWTLGALRGRLERGRERLRMRLLRRGVTLSAALLSAGLTQKAAGALPAPLAIAAVRAAVVAAAGGTVSSVVATKVLRLAEGGLTVPAITKKAILALLLAVAALGTALGALLRPPPAPGDSRADSNALAVAAAPRPETNVILAEDKPLADWPIFRGNPQQSGVAGSPLPDQLTVLWTFSTRDAVEAAAAIVAGTVYVASQDDHLYALDLASGKEKWKYKAAFKAPPSVRGGRVYAGDRDGVLHCVDAVTGKKVWTFATAGEIGSGVNFTGDTVLFCSSDGHLYCLTAQAAKLLWKFDLGGPSFSTPAIAGDRVFVVGCAERLHGLDTRNGREVSSVHFGGAAVAAPAVRGENLYVGTMTNQLLSINWKLGRVEWTFEAKKQRQPFSSSAAVTDNLVVVGSRDRRVYALGREKGEEVWSFLTGGRVNSSPVIVGNRVFVGSFDGKLHVLDLARGTELAQFDLDGPISASPAVAGNRLVISTQKGTVYCFGAKQ